MASRRQGRNPVACTMRRHTSRLKRAWSSPYRRAMVRHARLAFVFALLSTSPAWSTPEGRLLIEGRAYRVIEGDVRSEPAEKPAPAPWDNGAKLERDGRGRLLYVRGRVRRRLALPVDAKCGVRAPGPDGDVVCRVWKGGSTSGKSERTSTPLFRVTARGAVRRLTYPVSDRGSLDAVCGGRYWVAAFESLGTVIYDLETDTVVAEMPRVGAFHNARSWGPSCSPDGRLVAIPTPYSGEVTVLRVSDGSVVADFAFGAAGGVTWRESESPTLVVHQTFLPYE